ncbi:glycosyltransferase family 4 protein [Flavobacterium sp. SM15]|uniref:glycosyltransferase family 4 protein n=1 Tax=Flavobacterium sp. SM15 TaxID=2908005 RepID=UPI001ED9F320|nr:glycosyltransferase family 4 protein [Flavobacterium sp. SM15]MCG2611241.1 glycosyltransferase family 4 protein [Flavobacterium sp. SM15]
MKGILYIGNKLSGQGANVTTIETLGNLLSQEGYYVVYSSEKSNQLWRLLDMIWATWNNRSKVRYVLIDTYSTTGFWFAFVVSQLCRLLKKKYIPILHGGNLPKRLKKNPKLCKMVFKNAYKNVAPSNYLFKVFQDSGFSNLVYIPNNIELKNYPFKERGKLQPKLLWVRSFSRIYNPKMAVEVLSKLKERYPNASLCMVGPEKDGSKELCEHYALQKKCEVKFTGKLSKTQWTQLSADYDIFINTTHLDNTPVSVMEAMALGLPVVSTNVGGLPFLIKNEKEGLLVNDKDVMGMVNAVEKLLADEELSNKLSVSGRSKAETWDWEQVKLLWKKVLR